MNARDRAEKSRRDDRAARHAQADLIDAAEANVLALSLARLRVSAAADVHHEDWQAACDRLRTLDVECDAAVRSLAKLRAAKTP